MKKHIVDIQPGELYRQECNLTKQTVIYLKLRDQKAVNLVTWSLVKPDQQEEVEIEESTLILRDN